MLGGNNMDADDFEEEEKKEHEMLRRSNTGSTTGAHVNADYFDGANYNSPTAFNPMDDDLNGGFGAAKAVKTTASDDYKIGSQIEENK